ncbi:MAG TPA: hypothetical protein VGS96_05220 [Thermoanaerobaculia bacterium]|nr:hypothetical protein [Thermoanaerobaculia bacterium]
MRVLSGSTSNARCSSSKRGLYPTVLQQKDIVPLAVVSLGPQMTLVARVEQLRGDT